MPNPKFPRSKVIACLLLSSFLALLLALIGYINWIVIDCIQRQKFRPSWVAIIYGVAWYIAAGLLWWTAFGKKRKP